MMSICISWIIPDAQSLKKQQNFVRKFTQWESFNILGLPKCSLNDFVVTIRTCCCIRKLEFAFIAVEILWLLVHQVVWVEGPWLIDICESIWVNSRYTRHVPTLKNTLVYETCNYVKRGPYDAVDYLRHLLIKRLCQHVSNFSLKRYF